MLSWNKDNLFIFQWLHADDIYLLLNILETIFTHYNAIQYRVASIVYCKNRSPPKFAVEKNLGMEAKSVKNRYFCSSTDQISSILNPSRGIRFVIIRIASF